MGILENGSDLSERQTDRCLVGLWRIEELDWKWKGKVCSLSAPIYDPPSCILHPVPFSSAAAAPARGTCGVGWRVAADADESIHSCSHGQ